MSEVILVGGVYNGNYERVADDQNVILKTAISAASGLVHRYARKDGMRFEYTDSYVPQNADTRLGVKWDESSTQEGENRAG